MRHAAIHFAGLLNDNASELKSVSAIVTTDMLNVAELKGLLKPSLQRMPVIVYFHENQASYPNQNPA